MLVKLNLDTELGQWLDQLSTKECRTRPQQVIYLLKKIKDSQVMDLQDIASTKEDQQDTQETLQNSLDYIDNEILKF